MSELVINADFLFDGERRVHKDVSLIVQQGRIVRIEKRLSDCSFDFGCALILPGLVNAHTHLELSHLRRGADETADLIEWLKKMRAALDGTSPDALADAATSGIEEAVRNGTTTLLEHTNAGASIEPLLGAPIRNIVALETVGYSADDLTEKKEWILSQIKRIRNGKLSRPGIAPHSVYRLSPELIRFCAEVAEKEKLLISSHTSESKEEVEFSKRGTGRLRSLIERFGGSPDRVLPAGRTPVENLHSLGLLRRRTLLIHCNYPEYTDFLLIRESGAAVVYCPRSHAFFGHSPHPFERFLSEGVDVLFGTDSLASTPTLSVLDELKFVKRRHKNIPARLLLSLATSVAARRLLGDGFGKIEEGSPADLCAIALPAKPADAEEALEVALEAESEVVLTVCDGEIIFSEGV